MKYLRILFRLFLVTVLIILYSYLLGILYKSYEERTKINTVIGEIKKGTISNYDPYVAVLEIPKINLKKGLYDINNSLNDVEKNVEVNKSSDMPNIKNGNFILAAHSGLSFQSYFNNLENLTKNDEVILYYKNTKYIYKIADFYSIDKTGKALIRRDKNKNTITLITCKKNEDKQIVYLGYLNYKISY